MHQSSSLASKLQFGSNVVQMYASTWKSGTQLWQFGQALGVTGSYGLFRRMTGVGGKGQIARPEVTNNLTV